LSTGDQLESFRKWVYAPIDERMDSMQWDAQNVGEYERPAWEDYRIHTEQDGTYTIPTGISSERNGEEATESYTMGIGIPYRLKVTRQSGFITGGEVGNAPREVESADADRVATTKSTRLATPANDGWPY